MIENWILKIENSYSFPVHQPVLLAETIELFNPQPGQTYIDATINGGGHAQALAEKVSPNGKILGIDWDCDLIELLRIRNQKQGIKNIYLACDNYAHIKTIAENHGFSKVNGIFFDLGFSSYHIEQSGRGFSFLKDEPLNMRYHANHDDDRRHTAAEIINNSSEKELADIFWKYGEEKFSRRIAKEIVKERRKKPIQTTLELVKIIEKILRYNHHQTRLHPATRTFQALRIAVNGELENLTHALQDSLLLLAPGGKIAVISFHSLEDRIVKIFFKEREKENLLTVIAKKPIRASREEMQKNPRARSAKLRGAAIPLL